MSQTTPKDQKKAYERINFQNIKKPLIGSIVIIAVAISGILIGINLYEESQPKPTFYFGVGYNPFAPDPLKAGHVYDGVSIYLLQQIVEGLFTTEFINGGSHVVPNLAHNYSWTPDDLNLTCSLRPNIKFHDDSPLNAQAVKWNMDRLHRIYNDHGLGDYLWQFPDGEWIINTTEVVDDLTIKFILNRPFAPIISLLSSHYSYILRPNTTIEDNFIEPISNVVCGTGPFIYDSFKENESVTLLPNLDYWNGPNTKIDKIVFKIFINNTIGYEAMMSKEISMIMRDNYNENLEILKTIPGIIVRKIDTLITNVLDMNNLFINSTMRRAISYAFNYTNFIDNARNRSETRISSPIPPQVQYYNSEFDLPYCNLSIARQTLLDVQWNNTDGLIANDDITPGNPWETISYSPNPVATYNYSYISGWTNQELLIDPINESLKQIGVKMNSDPCTYGEFVGKLYGIWGYDRTHNLYLTGWNLDYNDPWNAINPLYSNASFDNTANVNDTQLQSWMEEALIETNVTEREQLYFNMQERIIEEIYPSLWLHFDLKYDAYISNLRGFPVQRYLKCSFKDVYFV